MAIDLPKPLRIDNAYAFIDHPTRLAVYKYWGVVTPKETGAVYAWIGATLQSLPPSYARGAVFDFREVEEFEIGNTPVAKRASKEANQNADQSELSLMPVVMLVGSLRQEVKVSTSMMGAPELRKRIVRSQEGGLEFLNKWNAEHNRTFDIDESMLNHWPTLD